MILTEHIAERLRPQPIGQGTVDIRLVSGSRNGIEEIGHELRPETGM